MSFSDLRVLTLEEVRKSDGEYLLFVDFKEPVHGHRGFYLFLSVVAQSDEMDVFFQAATPEHREFDVKDYVPDNLTFEGTGRAKKRLRNSLSISDVGHYIPERGSSWYSGSSKVDYCREIAGALEKIIARLSIPHENVVLIGGSAGGDGALRTATYMEKCVSVVAANPWIWLHDIHYLSEYYEQAFGGLSAEELNEQYGSQLNAIVRFKEAENIPILHLVLNRNDRICFPRNLTFLNECAGRLRRTVVNIYEGPPEHFLGRPPREVFLRRIEETRFLAYEEMTERTRSAADYLRYFASVALAGGEKDLAEKLLRAAGPGLPAGAGIRRLFKRLRKIILGPKNRRA